MRGLVFAHYDPHGYIDDHVMYSLRSYRPYFDTICFVSTANLGVEQIARAKSLADVVISRYNVGYDFISWRIGFECLRISEYDEIFFANDSCYGPCADIINVFERINASGADLWGATVNRQFRPHIQSSFMAFRKPLLSSGFASHFWSTVDLADSKQNLILNYEVGLSAAVESAGFSIGGLVDYVEIDASTRSRVCADNTPDIESEPWDKARSEILNDQFPNPLQLYWGESFRRGCPFIKVELLRDNPLGANIKNVVRCLLASQWYEVGLIDRHLERVAPISWRKVFGKN